MQRRSISVTIAGQRYSIKSDASDAYVHTLAQTVDTKIREVQRGSKAAPLQSLAVLAALQLADELERERKRRGELRQRVRERSQALKSYLAREVRA